MELFVKPETAETFLLPNPPDSIYRNYNFIIIK